MKFTKKYNLLLNNLKLQNEFAEVANNCHEEVMAENDVEGYIVSAKSVLGFYSLNLNKPVTITINNLEDAQLIEDSLKERDIKFTVVA